MEKIKKYKQKRVWPVASAENIISFVIFGIVMLINVLLTVFLELPLFDLIVSVTGILYIAILAERNILSFGIGAVDVVLYVILCFQTKLYGEAIFHCLYFLLIFPAFIDWRKAIKKNKEEEEGGKGQVLTVQSKKLKTWWYAILPLAIAAFTYVYGLLLGLIGGEHNFWDALSSGVTLVATVLAWKQFREQWIGWVFVFIVSIVLWLVAGNVLMVVMSCGCLIYSFKGFVEWWLQSKIHEMHLDNKSFLKIKEGTKTIELRLYDEKRRQIKIGDAIYFISRITQEKIKTKVTGLYVYKTFAELYSNFSPASMGYEKDEKATPEDMTKFYSKEKQEKNGVVAIEVQKIDLRGKVE